METEAIVKEGRSEGQGGKQQIKKTLAKERKEIEQGIGRWRGKAQKHRGNSSDSRVETQSRMSCR